MSASIGEMGVASNMVAFALRKTAGSINRKTVTENVEKTATEPVASTVLRVPRKVPVRLRPSLVAI